MLDILDVLYKLYALLAFLSEATELDLSAENRSIDFTHKGTDYVLQLKVREPLL